MPWFGDTRPGSRTSLPDATVRIYLRLASQASPDVQLNLRLGLSRDDSWWLLRKKKGVDKFRKF